MLQRTVHGNMLVAGFVWCCTQIITNRWRKAALRTYTNEAACCFKKVCMEVTVKMVWKLYPLNQISYVKQCYSRNIIPLHCFFNADQWCFIKIILVMFYYNVIFWVKSHIKVCDIVVILYAGFKLPMFILNYNNISQNYSFFFCAFVQNRYSLDECKKCL